MLKLVASAEELKEWQQKYRAGGMGYGTAKKRLVELLHEYFGPYRQKRAELENDPGFVNSVLESGAQRARLVAQATMDRVRRATGLRG
jgi:tryptophanyl-tRNA synthetase